MNNNRPPYGTTLDIGTRRYMFDVEWNYKMYDGEWRPCENIEQVILTAFFNERVYCATLLKKAEHHECIISENELLIQEHFEIMTENDGVIKELSALVKSHKDALERLGSSEGFKAIGMPPYNMWGDELKTRQKYANAALEDAYGDGQLITHRGKYLIIETL